MLRADLGAAVAQFAEALRIAEELALRPHNDNLWRCTGYGVSSRRRVHDDQAAEVFLVVAPVASQKAVALLGGMRANEEIGDDAVAFSCSAKLGVGAEHIDEDAHIRRCDHFADVPRTARMNLSVLIRPPRPPNT